MLLRKEHKFYREEQQMSPELHRLHMNVQIRRGPGWKPEETGAAVAALRACAVAIAEGLPFPFSLVRATPSHYATNIGAVHIVCAEESLSASCGASGATRSAGRAGVSREAWASCALPRRARRATVVWKSPKRTRSPNDRRRSAVLLRRADPPRSPALRSSPRRDRVAASPPGARRRADPRRATRPRPRAAGSPACGRGPAPRIRSARS